MVYACIVFGAIRLQCSAIWRGHWPVCQFAQRCPTRNHNHSGACINGILNQYELCINMNMHIQYRPSFVCCLNTRIEVFFLLYFLWIYFVHILFGCRTHPIANIRSGASVHIRWCPSEIQKNLMRKQWCRIFLVKCNLFYIFQLFIFVYILAHFAWLIFRKLQMEKVFELRNNCTAKAFWAEASYIYIPHNRKCVTLCVAEIFFCFFSGIFYSREISTRTEQNMATNALIECMIFGVRLRIS